MSEELKSSLDVPIQAIEKLLYDPKMMKNIILVLTRFLTMPIIVLIRRNFGERVFSLFNLFTIFFIIFSVETVDYFLHNVVPSQSSRSNFETNGLSIFGTIFMVFGLYHTYVIYKRNQAGHKWHSRYDGDRLFFFQYLPFSYNGRIVCSVYEPIFVLLLSIMVVEIWSVGILSNWLYFSSFALLMHSEMQIKIWRDQYLDAVDSEIASQQMNAALSGSPPEQTNGFIVHGISNSSRTERERILKNLKAIKNKNYV